KTLEEATKHATGAHVMIRHLEGPVRKTKNRGTQSLRSHWYYRASDGFQSPIGSIFYSFFFMALILSISSVCFRSSDSTRSFRFLTITLNRLISVFGLELSESS